MGILKDICGMYRGLAFDILLRALHRALRRTVPAVPILPGRARYWQHQL